MEMYYRVEFNETQQTFHLEWLDKPYVKEPNTHGWFTVIEKCNDLDFQIFESFVNRIPLETLDKKYLLKCVYELERFKANLSSYEISIQRHIQ